MLFKQPVVLYSVIPILWQRASWSVWLKLMPDFSAFLFSQEGSVRVFFTALLSTVLLHVSVSVKIRFTIPFVSSFFVSEGIGTSFPQSS